MIEITIDTKPVKTPFPGVWVLATIDLTSAKMAITDTVLRESLCKRIAEDMYEEVFQYFNSAKGREEVWALDNSINADGAPAPAPQE